MKEKIDKIKAIFLDVDNTALCLKMYDFNGINDKEHGTRIIGLLDDKDWMAYNIKNNAYKYCEAPRQLVDLVNYVKKRGAMIYGLSECKNSFEYNAKYNRLKECYAGSFNHHGELISVHTRHDKVAVMKIIAERDGLEPEEIMFIDDSYPEVMEAHEAGFLAMHATEAIMRFDDMESFLTNGVYKQANENYGDATDNELPWDME